MAERQECAHPKLDAGHDLPPPPADLPAQRLTLVAIGTTIVAAVMTLPILVQSFSWSRTGERPDFSGWPWALLEPAFFVGVTSSRVSTGSTRRLRC